MELVEFREGKARILAPKFEKLTSKAKVFYNPEMSFDRDLSSLLISSLADRLEVCDALAGTGVGGIRYALECASKIHLNDLNPEAFRLIKKNLRLNNIEAEVSNLDANMLLRERKFDVVDIDPFGSPVYYLDSAMCALRNNSMFFITATDTSPLCGSSPKACLRKYGVKSFRTEFSKELGVRILISKVLRVASKYNLSFKPLLSYWRKHYFRVFLKARKGKLKTYKTLKDLRFIYYCDCLNRGILKKPIEMCNCGKPLKFLYPIYTGNLKSNDLLNKMLDLKDIKFLRDLRSELDEPFYFDTHIFCSKYKLPLRKLRNVICELEERGFKASRTHFCKTGIKTDVSFEDFKEIFEK